MGQSLRAKPSVLPAPNGICRNLECTDYPNKTDETIKRILIALVDDLKAKRLSERDVKYTVTVS